MPMDTRQRRRSWRRVLVCRRRRCEFGCTRGQLLRATRLLFRFLRLHRLPTRDEVRPVNNEPHLAFEPSLTGSPQPPSGAPAAVSSPWVSVELHSMGGFCCVSSSLPLEQPYLRRFETPRVLKNGYNPIFGCKVHCVASQPMQTVLRIAVEDIAADDEPE